ncbi:MAG TPA: heme o synthase [Candidatus Saccharimonadales bacterium]|nr:heme o synthase [Candidatus Saccharimonadales bacterium]
MTVSKTVRNYVEVTKPPIVSLLVFTSLATMIVAWRKTLVPLDWIIVGAALLAITAASAGCDVLTSYIDRDIDAVMDRTKERPIPSGRIRANRALVWGLFLASAGMALAYWINALSFVWIALGVFDNVVVYSLLLKRRSRLNIILGGVSGGLPVMFGWSAITNSYSLLPVLLAALVVLWIPGHIWSLAIFTRKDYQRAHVPMLPVVTDLTTALRCIVSTVVLMIPFSLWIFFEGGFGLVYLVTAILFGLWVLYVNFKLFLHPNDDLAYKAFKVSSPYLFALFLALIIDSFVHLI